MCVVAAEQTAGRGRHGRTWISEKDAGLYFTILLRPKSDTKFLPLITLMTAVVVCEVLSELFDIKADIKWSNDVLVREKKICGILAETAETSLGLAVVVGIGINLKNSNFPPDLIRRATSVENESGKIFKPADLEELLNSLTKFFRYFYAIFQTEDGAAKIREEWAKRSSYFQGKPVRVVLANEIIRGTTCGLEENGALRIRTFEGDLKIIRAGDVERLRTAEEDEICEN